MKNSNSIFNRGTGWNEFIKKGGSRKTKNRKYKMKRGGNISSVLGRLSVPAVLLFLQQKYTKKRRS